VEQTVLWSVRDVRQPLLVPICRKPTGSITPKTQWLLYAGNPVASLCRKRIGSYVPEDDTRSTLAAWVGQCGARLQPLVEALKARLLECAVLHADETPVSMLAPGTGKTHRAYLWAWTAAAHESIQAVVYDFTASRSGEHARAFLGHDRDRCEREPIPWTGHLVCDDFSGYKWLFERGVTEVGCMAHARRKFVELHVANKSEIAQAALELIGKLYDVERDARDLTPQERLQLRRTRAAPVARALHEWLLAQRVRVSDGTATAKAIDYSLNRWRALVRYLDDPRLPIDNNHDEQQIRPWATGRKNWLFAGTLAAGQRAAAIVSLIRTSSSACPPSEPARSTRCSHTAGPRCPSDDRDRFTPFTVNLTSRDAYGADCRSRHAHTPNR